MLLGRRLVVSDLERSSLLPLPTAKGPTGVVTVQVGEHRYTVELLRGMAVAWSKEIARDVAGMDAEWLSKEFKRLGWKASFRET
jgi:hypothetical protein